MRPLSDDQEVFLTIRSLQYHRTQAAAFDPRDQPGGRHENDAADHRSIVIVPTLEEVTCVTPAYLPSLAHVEAAASEEAREALTLERQFRLLREDVVAPLREEVQKTLQRPEKLLRNFRIQRVVTDEKRFCVSVVVRVDLPPGHKGRSLRSDEERKAFWGGPGGAGLLKRDTLVRSHARAQRTSISHRIALSATISKASQSAQSNPFCGRSSWPCRSSLLLLPHAPAVLRCSSCVGRRPTGRLSPTGSLSASPLSSGGMTPSLRNSRTLFRRARRRPYHPLSNRSDLTCVVVLPRIIMRPIHRWASTSTMTPSSTRSFSSVFHLTR